MLSPTRYLRLAVIAAGLASLALVLSPQYVAPLWEWAKFVAGSFGTDPLPTFEHLQHYSGLTLAGFVVGGVVYNLWRDRRFRYLQVEYVYQTRATHLKEKVRDLEADLRKTAVDRDKWQEAYAALTKQHASALVTSKEHEIRSEYGRADRETLTEMRKEFDTLMRAKGSMEGFREAMQIFFANQADRDKVEGEKIPEVIIEGSSNGMSRNQQKKRSNLPLFPSSLSK